MSQVETSFSEVKRILFQIAELMNRLRNLGLIRSADKITGDYAKWFCSFKFGLELFNKDNFGYDVISL